MGTPTLDVVAARAAKKVQPIPRTIDVTGKDQDDYRQEAYMHALAALAQAPEGVDESHYLARTMRNWVYRQWTARQYQLPCCHTDCEVGLAVDRYAGIDRLIDVRRSMSAADWAVLMAHTLIGVDRRFRTQVYRVRKELMCKN